MRKTIAKVLTFVLLSIFVSAMTAGAAFSVSAQEQLVPIKLTTDKVRMWTGETATLTLLNATDCAEWYVNEELQVGETGSTFAFSTLSQGYYSIYAQTNGVRSNVCNVKVLASYAGLLNKYHYAEGKTFSSGFEDFEFGPMGNSFNGDPKPNEAHPEYDPNAFEVKEVEGNKVLTPYRNQWSGTPYLFREEIAAMELDDFEIAVDVYYPEGARGICAMNLDNIVNDKKWEIGGLHYLTNATSLVYAAQFGGGGQVFNSSKDSLNGTLADLGIKNGEWNRLRIIKIGQDVFYFINDTFAGRVALSYEFTQPLAIGFAYFPNTKHTGAYFDNFFVGALEEGEPQPIAITSLEMAYADERVIAGNVAAFQVAFIPYNADLSSIQWYVDGKLVKGQIGALLNYPCSDVGVHTVKAVSGDLFTQETTFRVVSMNSLEISDTSDWVILREETFDDWNKDTAWGPITDSAYKANGNGIVEHRGGPPYNKSGMFWAEGTGNVPIDYELSFDFMLKTGTKGYADWSIGGFFADAVDKEVRISVCKNTEEAYLRILDSSSGKEILRSDDLSLGGLGVDLADIITYGEWHTFTACKCDGSIALYMDGQLVARTDFNRSTNCVAKYCIITTNFPDQPSAGCYFDNVRLRAPRGEGFVDWVTLEADMLTLKPGEKTAITAKIGPADAEYSFAQWFVNGKSMITGTELRYEFCAEKVGTYTIKCVIDDKESNEIIIVVSADNATVSDADKKGCNGILSSGCIYVGLLAAGAVVFTRKKISN